MSAEAIETEPLKQLERALCHRKAQVRQAAFDRALALPDDDRLTLMQSLLRRCDNSTDVPAWAAIFLYFPVAILVSHTWHLTTLTGICLGLVILIAEQDKRMFAQRAYATLLGLVAQTKDTRFLHRLLDSEPKNWVKISPNRGGGR